MVVKRALRSPTILRLKWFRTTGKIHKALPAMVSNTDLRKCQLSLHLVWNSLFFFLVKKMFSSICKIYLLFSKVPFCDFVIFIFGQGEQFKELHYFLIYWCNELKIALLQWSMLHISEYKTKIFTGNACDTYSSPTTLSDNPSRIWWPFCPHCILYTRAPEQFSWCAKEVELQCQHPEKGIMLLLPQEQGKR